MAQTEFSNSALIKQGWGATKSNVSTLLKILLTYIALSVVVSLVDSVFKQNAVLVALVSLVNTVIQTVLEIGMIKIGLDIVDGKKPDIKDLYQNYNRFIEFFFTSLLVGLMILVGFILLIVPGIYLAVKYQFTLFNVIDKKLTYSKAWGASSEMVKGRWMKVFLFDLSLIGLNILGALALGVGLLLTIPTSYFAGLYLYKKLSA